MAVVLTPGTIVDRYRVVGTLGAGSMGDVVRGVDVDLNRQVAVPASERGPGDNMLGPYPSRADAENWKAKVEARNDQWDDDDEDDERDDGEAAPARTGD